MPRGDQGIRVPPDPNCLLQHYNNSTVSEYFQTEALREDRVSQLRRLGRNPVVSFAHDTVSWGDLKDVWAVTWTEPRGEELDAVRTGS